MSIESSLAAEMVPHVIKGRLDVDATEDFGAFRCPKIALNDLAVAAQRTRPGL